MEACDVALELDKCKLSIYSYVESRMAFIAPNLSILVGAPIAAKLMGRFLIFSKGFFFILEIFFFFILQVWLED